ncbi:MAG: hypothetical protein Q4F79_08580 [Eubacteriales bacterium]|nr:hypothetical protein [Eubacteriales bacterium]
MGRKEKISGNKIVGGLWYQYQRLIQYPHYRDEMKKIEERKKGQIPSELERIHALKDTQKGKRCFVVADSTALTASERRLLDDEITFGTASSLQENWQPTYLTTQNPREYRELEQRLCSDYSGTVFVGDNLAGQAALPERFIQFPYLGVYKYYCNRYREYHTKFSGNAAEVVYDGYTVVYSMLQIAVTMGFREIYLVGCRCCHAQDERIAAAYRVAKQFADAHGILICNSTTGEEADIFPYRSFQQIFA